MKLDDGEDDSESEAEDTLEPDTYYENIEVDEDDERALEMFMNPNPQARRTLADIIMDKITEKHTELETKFSDAGSIQMQDLDPRVKQMYEQVGQVLQKYRSGKLPKAFKIIPKLRNWEQILYITGKRMIICHENVVKALNMYRSVKLVGCSYVSSDTNLCFKFKGENGSAVLQSRFTATRSR